jgi:hypothetical protein
LDSYYADQEREAAVHDADPPFPAVDRARTAADRRHHVFDIVVTIYMIFCIPLLFFFPPFYFLSFLFIRRQFTFVCDPLGRSSRLARYLGYSRDVVGTNIP